MSKPIVLPPMPPVTNNEEFIRLLKQVPTKLLQNVLEPILQKRQSQLGFVRASDLQAGLVKQVADHLKAQRSHEFLVCGLSESRSRALIEILVRAGELRTMLAMAPEGRRRAVWHSPGSNSHVSVTTFSTSRSVDSVRGLNADTILYAYDQAQLPQWKNLDERRELMHMYTAEPPSDLMHMYTAEPPSDQNTK
jgi:hypothetical protein